MAIKSRKTNHLLRESAGPQKQEAYHECENLFTGTTPFIALWILY